VKALVEYAPSLSLSEVRKVNNKALAFLKKMTLDFKDASIKIQSLFLSTCLFEITKERDLANAETMKGKKSLEIEQG